MRRVLPTQKSRQSFREDLLAKRKGQRDADVEISRPAQFACGPTFFILGDDGWTDGNFGSFNYGINNSQTGFWKSRFVSLLSAGRSANKIRLSSL